MKKIIALVVLFIGISLIVKNKNSLKEPVDENVIAGPAKRIRKILREIRDSSRKRLKRSRKVRRRVPISKVSDFDPEFIRSWNIAKKLLENDPKAIGRLQAAAKSRNPVRMVRDEDGRILVFVKPWYEADAGVGKYLDQQRLLAGRGAFSGQAEMGAYNLGQLMGVQEYLPHVSKIYYRGDWAIKEKGIIVDVVGSDHRQPGKLSLSKKFRKNKEQKKIYRKLNAQIFTDEELTVFQKFACFDFLLGNMDRHGDNWFVKITDNKLTGIKMIDHGNCFIEKNPGKITKGHKLFSKPFAGYQYKWRKFNIADQPFTEETKQFILDNMTEDALEKFVKLAVKGEKRKGFFSEGAEKQIRRRLEIVREGILQGVVSTPRELGDLVSDIKQDAVLREVGSFLID